MQLPQGRQANWQADQTDQAQAKTTAREPVEAWQELQTEWTANWNRFFYIKEFTFDYNFKAENGIARCSMACTAAF